MKFVSTILSDCRALRTRKTFPCSSIEVQRCPTFFLLLRNARIRDIFRRRGFRTGVVEKIERKMSSFVTTHREEKH